LTLAGLLISVLFVVGIDASQPASLVSFPTEDGGTIYANSYGYGPHAVVLGSNGCGAKESWEPQAQRLVAEGYKVLAIDFRGNGHSHGGPESRGDEYHLDVLAAVRYLHLASTSVSVIGASCAGDAAAQAAVDARPGEIERLVLLAHGGIEHPELTKGRKLFVVTRDDANTAGLRLPKIRAQYEKTPEPKELIILDGSAHAQRIFETEQSERLMREILRFLSAP
jgi:pimeloyl-ACP methyl ester carboxylesterase